NTSRRLNPLIIDRAADGGYVNPYFVGNLLHFQWFDKFGAIVKKSGLMIDYRLRYTFNRTAALFNRFDKPLGGGDFSLDEFLRLIIRLAIFQHLQIPSADEKR